MNVKLWFISFTLELIDLGTPMAKSVMQQKPGVSDLKIT